MCLCMIGCLGWVPIVPNPYNVPSKQCVPLTDIHVQVKIVDFVAQVRSYMCEIHCDRIKNYILL
jgi:hypothetical protein